MLLKYMGGCTDTMPFYLRNSSSTPMDFAIWRGSGANLVSSIFEFDEYTFGFLCTKWVHLKTKQNKKKNACFHKAYVLVR